MTGDPHALVVAYGGDADLAQCLLSLRGELATTVVDNTSSPSCEEIVRSAGARYVNAGGNIGFAAGVNRGLELLAHPRPDVLLLNPDAAVGPEAVRALHQRLRSSPRLAGVAPALVGTDGRAQRVTWPFPSPARMWREALGLGRLGSHWDFLIGAVLLLRAEALEEVGPFDERFFLYAEEVDWQRRARALDWELAYCPEISATHRGAGTSTDPVLREVRFHCAQERFIRKWHGSLGWEVYRAGGVAGGLLRTIRPDRVGRRSARARAALYVHGPCRRMAAPPRRA